MSNLYNFTPDLSPPVETSGDRSRQVATDDEYISIKEALEIFITKGRPTSERTLQRYCEKQQLSGQKVVTGEGEKWFVTRSSVLTRIEELNKFDALRASRQVATSSEVSSSVVQENKKHFTPDQSRQAATPSVSSPVVAQEISHSTSHDMSRQASSSRDASWGSETSQPQNFSTLSAAERELYERLLAIHEEQRTDLLKDKELLQADKEALLRQLEAKDKQIERFFESERDTKTLAGRLQSLMSALWPKKDEQSGERYVPMHEALESGLPEQRDER